MSYILTEADNVNFNNFLKQNKEVIKSLVPKNPTIGQDDEWRYEDFWDAKETDKP